MPVIGKHHRPILESNLMTRTCRFVFAIAPLASALLASAMLSGCSQPQSVATDTPTPTTPSAPQQASNPDVLRFRIGTLEAAALKDGDIEAANDGNPLTEPDANWTSLFAAPGYPDEPSGDTC